MNEFSEKYLKYKIKYLELKKQIGGDLIDEKKHRIYYDDYLHSKNYKEQFLNEGHHLVVLRNEDSSQKYIIKCLHNRRGAPNALQMVDVNRHDYIERDDFKLIHSFNFITVLIVDYMKMLISNSSTSDQSIIDVFKSRNMTYEWNYKRLFPTNKSRPKLEAEIKDIPEYPTNGLIDMSKDPRLYAEFNEKMKRASLEEIQKEVLDKFLTEYRAVVIKNITNILDRLKNIELGNEYIFTDDELNFIIYIANSVYTSWLEGGGGGDIRGILINNRDRENVSTYLNMFKIYIRIKLEIKDPPVSIEEINALTKYIKEHKITIGNNIYWKYSKLLDEEFNLNLKKNINKFMTKITENDTEETNIITLYTEGKMKEDKKNKKILELKKNIAESFKDWKYLKFGMSVFYYELLSHYRAAQKLYVDNNNKFVFLDNLNLMYDKEIYTTFFNFVKNDYPIYRRFFEENN
jgi:hypothetical protein